MASDFDDLVKHLQFVLAIKGQDGLSFEELYREICTFYDNKNEPAEAASSTPQGELFFSEEPPGSVAEVTTHVVDSAWEWLTKLKDVTVITRPDVSGDAGIPKLVASKEQLWLAVAGHGPDNSKIKKTELTLLHIIAQHGSQGIPQPDLVKESGQDKRSVPQRTDALTKGGYITKVPVISNGSKTSLLKLMRYAVNSATTDAVQAPISDKIVFYDRWYDELMRLLKNNNGIVAVDDLRSELDIPSNHWQVKALQRCIRRLQSSGLIRRIRAKSAGKKEGDRGFHIRCIQRMREPTDDDRLLWLMNRKDQVPFANVQMHADASAVDDEDEDDGDDVDVEVGSTIDPTTTKPRIVAQWLPDEPLTNFLFEIIERSGPTGISIMDLHKRGVGQVWRRPLDEALIRLCDKWQTSQPPHLKHLTIIKDTGAIDRFTFFKYRSIANFEEAVRNGDAFWEAVRYKSKDKNEDTPLTTELDAHGFPVLSRKLFVKDGTAPMSQCARIAETKSFKVHEEDSAWTVYRKETSRNSAAKHHSQNVLALQSPSSNQDVRKALPGLAVPRFQTQTPRIRSTPVVPSSHVRSQKQTSVSRTVSGLSLVESNEEVGAPEDVESPTSRPTASLEKAAAPKEGHTTASLLPSPKVDADAVLCATPRTPSALREHSDAEVVDHTPRTSAGSHFRAASTNKKNRSQQTLMCMINSSRAVRLRNEAMPNRVRHRRNLVITIRLARLHELSCFAGTFGPSEHAQQSSQTDPGMPAENQSETEPGTQDTGFFDVELRPPVQESEPVPTTPHAPDMTVNAEPSRIPAPSPSLANEPVSPSRKATPGQEELIVSSTKERFSVPTIVAAERVHQPKQRKITSAMSRATGTVILKRAQVIMDVVRACNGLYPGNKEIFQPVSLALKRTAGSGSDPATVNNAVKNLISKGKLRKMIFTHHDQSGLQVQRAILADPSIAPGDPRVAALQKKMNEVYPAKYFPPEAEVPPEARATPAVRTKQPEPIIIDHFATMNTGGNDMNFPLEPGLVVRRFGVQYEATEERYEAQAKDKADYRASRLVRHPTKDSDDEDVSDPDSEQERRMTEFQASEYKHNDSHAFISREKGKRITTRNSAKSFFASPKRSSSKRGETSSSVQSEPASQFDPAVSNEMYERNAQLLLNGYRLYHGSSGTIGTCGMLYDTEVFAATTPQVMAPVFNAYHNTFFSATRPRHLPVFAPEPGRHLPIARLQSLGSNMLAYSQFRNIATQSQQVAASARSLQAVSVVPPKRKADVVETVKASEPKKRKARVYKSLKGNKKALGLLEHNARTRTSDAEFEIVDHESLMSVPSFALNKKRDRKGPANFADNDRLASAVALFRTIMGGMDQRNNWGVIAHMLSFKYEADFLRRRWDAVKNAQESTVRNTMQRIYEPFLAAYESGKMPYINFADLNRSDWVGVLEWFEREVPGATNDFLSTQLPRSMSRFHQAYSVTLESSIWEQSKDAWHTSPIETLRKTTAHEFVYGCALPGLQRPTNSFLDDKLVLKTWIRAVAATKAESYDSDLAGKKLQAFTESEISTACEEMVAVKTIRHMNKGRQQPGRNFEIHDAHWAVFRRWPGKTVEWRYLRNLALARHKVLGRFQATERVYMDFHSDDAEVAVLLNMVDQGLLKISSKLPARNDDFDAPFPKISAVGYSGYSYNAKTLDREKLRFPIVFEQTDKFTFEHGLIGGVPIPKTPDVKEQHDRLPFWMDIHNNLLPDIWDLVLRSILHLIVFRPGCTSQLMEVSHAHKIMAWEIDLALGWMEKSGIALRCGAGKENDGVWEGGWRASEWWYCAFESEMTFWKVE